MKYLRLKHNFVIPISLLAEILPSRHRWGDWILPRYNSTTRGDANLYLLATNLGTEIRDVMIKAGFYSLTWLLSLPSYPRYPLATVRKNMWFGFNSIKMARKSLISKKVENWPRYVILYLFYIYHSYQSDAVHSKCCLSFVEERLFLLKNITATFFHALFKWYQSE